MKRIVIESPLAGDETKNLEYARACMRDSLLRGEAPIASHVLYAQPGILIDADPDEREIGIAAGLEWGRSAEAYAVYTDQGMTEGMERGIEWAITCGIPVEYRTLSFASADGRRNDDKPEVTQPSEAEVLRRRRFAEIGKLPLDYRTHVIIVGPNASVSIQADDFALYELLGLIEMCATQIRLMMARPSTEALDGDEPQRTM